MSGKTDTWMPLYVGDYLKDTTHLSTIEHGAYLLLLMAYWTHQGPLPDEDSKLARIVRLPLKHWKSIRENVVEMFKKENGQLVSTRAEKEISAAKIRSEKARASALERHNRGRANAPSEHEPSNHSSTAPDMLVGARPSASPSPSPSPEGKSSVSNETGVTPLFEDPQKAVFDLGKRVLGKSAGGQIVKLLAFFNGDCARTFSEIERAAGKQNAGEYIARILLGPRPYDFDSDPNYRNLI